MCDTHAHADTHEDTYGATANEDTRAVSYTHAYAHEDTHGAPYQGN